MFIFQGYLLANTGISSGKLHTSYGKVVKWEHESITQLDGTTHDTIFPLLKKMKWIRVSSVHNIDTNSKL
jgi:hypothetical protein